MIDREYLNILCPICNRQLERIRYTARGTLIEDRIRCTDKKCGIDTGRQCTLSDAFQAFIYMYYGANSLKLYEKGKTDEKVYL